MKEAVETVCDQHDAPFDCPDVLLHYTPKFAEYGIIVHDGGSSVLGIDYCPWCGSKLPESKRDRWFEELQRLKRNQGKLKYPKNKTRRSANWNHKPDQLFISYAQRNTKRAHKLANDLRSRG